MCKLFKNLYSLVSKRVQLNLDYILKWHKSVTLQNDLGTEQLATTVVTTQLIYNTVVIITSIKIQLCGLLKFAHHFSDRPTFKTRPWAPSLRSLGAWWGIKGFKITEQRLVCTQSCSYSCPSLGKMSKCKLQSTNDNNTNFTLFCMHCRRRRIWIIYHLLGKSLEV